jgi:hypothetical protein
LVELETINMLVQIVGVSAAAIATVVGVRSYIVSNKRAEEAKKKEQETQELALKAQQQNLETRQAQLLMQIFDRVSNKDFTRNWGETNYFWKWTDDEDYWKKYGANPEEYPKAKNVIDTYEGIGAILENKLVDPKMIYGVLRADPILYWEKFSPLMKKFAERAGESMMYPGFELLCSEMRRQYEVAHGYKFGHKIRHADDYLRGGVTQVQPP